MLTANFHGDTAMSFRIPAPLRSRSTASRGRRSGKQAGSWRWPILAVVLGLFAHQDALAQDPLTDLTLTDTDTASPVTIVLDPLFTDDVTERSFTATTEVTAGTVLRSVPFGVTQVTVTPTPVDDTWTLAYSGPADANGAIDGHQRNLTPGSNTITVTVTKSGETTQTYTIAMTRAAEIGSALSALTVTDILDEAESELGTAFDSSTNTTTFEADVALATAQVTVTATPKDGWTTEFLEPDAVAGGAYQRNLAVGANRIRIRATPDGASGTRDYTITVTRTTTPGEPRSLRATSTGVDGTVRLTWIAPSSNGDRAIEDYQFRSQNVETNDGEWVEADGWADVPNSDDSTTSADVSTLTDLSTPLVNGTTYMFQVRATNANGGGRPSDTVEATPAGPLGAPQDLTTEAGSRRVKLRWTHLTDASLIGYQYRRSVGAGSYGGWTNIAERDLVTETVTVANDSRSYTVTGLNNGTEYRFQVRGRNSVGGGAASTEVPATPMARAPGAPTNLSATADDEQVTLSWSAPSDNGGEPLTRYEYKQEATSGGTDGQWKTTGGTRTTVTVYDLVNGTPYYFTVRAVNDLGCTDTVTAGCSQPSPEVSATPFGAPDAIVDLAMLRVQDVGDRRVVLRWTVPETDPPLPADDYDGFQYRQKASGGYGSWIDVSGGASADRQVVAGLVNGTTYTFQVRAVNGSGGGLASNERSATPFTTPGAPRLTATAGDEEVGLAWTLADNGGRRIREYQCEWRIGAVAYVACPRSPLTAPAASLTLTDDDGIENNTTYTFRVRALNTTTAGEEGEWSNEDSARPTDTSGARRFAISATIDGKSWAKVNGAFPLVATVEVNPRFTAQSTSLTVTATAGEGVTFTGNTTATAEFGPTDSTQDALFGEVTPSGSGEIVIALLSPDSTDASDALAVTSVEIRPDTTPDPPMGLTASRGDGEVTLSWATVKNDRGDRAQTGYDWHYRQRQSGAYERWTNFARDELVSDAVTSNTVTGLDGGTYAFQVRALIAATPTAASDPSDEVTVSLSGTVEPTGLSAPRDLAATPGNGQVTLSWTAPASDGGAAITGYQYQQRAGTAAYSQWTAVPGGSAARSFTVTGLANGTRYLFRVRAVNSTGPGAASTEEAATPLLNVDTTLRTLTLTPGTLSPPFTPATRIYAAAVSSGVVQVTVAAIPNKPGVAATITPADASPTAAGHQVALAVGPNPIRVTVTDGANTGVYTITVTRAGRAPGAPTGLTATADEDGGGAVALSWTAPVDGGTVGHYEYQQKTSTGVYGTWTRIPGSGPATRAYTVTGLTVGTAYVFRIRAVNSVGNGAASNEAAATPVLTRLVWAKTEREVADAITAARNEGYGDDSTFTSGETVEIRGSSLFNAAEGVSLTFTATSDTNASAAAAVSGGTVTVTARAGGMATITITARAPQSSGVTIVEQTDPREASIQFDVEVGLEALTLELSGPEDGTNLVEGGRRHANGTAGTVTVRATANRAVTENVTVTLMADRAMSDAIADDFEADPIVIEAGETRGSTVVTAVEDETAEGMEELVLFGVTEGNAGAVTGEVRLRLWDAAVPALPVIAQLLLAAFLLWVSGRRYRLRR